MMPPGSPPTTMQRLTREAADRHGFIALFPRGRQGLCSWDPSVEDWWCWPTSRANVDAHAAGFVAQWDASAALIESILSVSIVEHYLLGFSNGGYFSSYIALEDLWPNQGAGLVAAGRWSVDPSLFPAIRPPFYIAVGALDTEGVKNSAQNLAWILYTEGWPRQYVEHPGRGHSIAGDDFDNAWTLWH